MDVLATRAGEEARRRAKVARDTLLRVAYVDRSSADVATGRGVSTAHETVAAALGMSSKTVQRSRMLLETLGFAVTIRMGRYLTAAERAEAKAAHGGHQLRAASLRSLTVPRPKAVENVHLPEGLEASKEASVKKNSQTRTSARSSAASRPPAGKNRIDHSKGPAFAPLPRPIELQQFAAKLAARMPWLSRGRHIGHLCNMLHEHHIDPRRWTVETFLETIARGNAQSGVFVLDSGCQRDPVRYLGWQIRSTIDPAMPTPLEETLIRQDRLAAERAERARERAAEQDRMAAVDEAEIDRIIAQMKIDQAERDRRTRRRRR